ncbi:MAG: adenylate kinase [Candidatus Eisenbacteria bacterium]|nr:adenylate kinase [Candidatus Eisenbacteria bacterium]
MTETYYKRVILLGPPGSGKGTQAERLRERLEVPILGTGDILRAEIADDSELGRKAKEYVDSGRLVPDGLIIEMMRGRLSRKDARQGFILDGFPRTVEQAEGLDEILAGLEMKLERVIEIAVDPEVVVQRMSARRVCRNCGRVYNAIHNPPEKEGVCDSCGGEVVQRSDDNPETIRQRLEVYRTNTEPLIAYYEKRGVLRHIDGEGSVDEIQERLLLSLRR